MSPIEESELEKGAGESLRNEVWLRAELSNGQVVFVGLPALSGTITPPPRPKNQLFRISVNPDFCSGKPVHESEFFDIALVFDKR